MKNDGTQVGPTQALVLDIMADRNWYHTREILEQIPYYEKHETGMRQALNVLLKLSKKGLVKHRKGYLKAPHLREVNIWRVNSYDE